MLVMRNFGFLGLHSSIHSQSKLACDRLVDFTGDVQVRRRRQGEESDCIDDDDGRIYSIDVWHKDFVGEPTVDGGRSQYRSKDDLIEDSTSPLYAQEVAQIPIFHNKSAASTRHVYFHTSFCNELILGPRCLHNCTKRNITIKIEIRRLEFNEDMNSLLAILPESPMIHNNRRGPFLVNESYTSCAYHKVDPKFTDDFKIKLPLYLQNKCSHDDDDGKLVAFFSVYNVSVKGRKKWSLITTKGDEDERSGPLELLGCGYLPLCTNENASCLISDGVHNVTLKYFSKEMSSFRDKIESKEGNESVNLTEVSDKEIHSPRILILEAIETQKKTGENSNNDDEFKGNISDSMVMQVRSTSFSSVHAQNPTLSAFFRSMPQAPRCELSNKQTFGQILDESKATLFEEEEGNLLINTINIAKSSMCPTYELVSHFLRINLQLWRSLICGIGEPSLSWSNPASLIALRLHSFSSLLHVLNAVSLCLSKVGVTELNGKGKWDMSLMSRIVVMLFDEDIILPGPNEIFILQDKEQSSCQSQDTKVQDSCINEICLPSNDPCSFSQNKQENKSRSCENPHSPPAVDGIEFVDTKKTRLSSQDDINILEVENKPSPLRARSLSAPNSKALKIDTKTDFQTALNSMLSPSSSSPFGSTSGPAATRRKWMTLPSSSLATIQEDNDRMDERQEFNDVQSYGEADDKGDALDTELFKTKANKVKQFRVPKLQQISSSDNHKSLLEETTPTEITSSMSSDENDKPKKVVPKTDEEIADAGTAFLDMIGENFGYR